MPTAHQILSAVQSGAAREAIESMLIEALSNPSDALVRHVAAIELAKINPKLITEPVLREMMQTLADLQYFRPTPLEDAYSEATATDEDCLELGQEIVLAFAHLECGQADYVVSRLLEFWSFDFQFYELAHAMIAIAFPRTKTPLEELAMEGLQFRVLQAVVERSEIWGSDAYWPETLSKHGLPQHRQGVYDLLGYERS